MRGIMSALLLAIQMAILKNPAANGVFCFLKLFEKTFEVNDILIMIFSITADSAIN